jgi:hypothetical protein
MAGKYAGINFDTAAANAAAYVAAVKANNEATDAVLKATKANDDATKAVTAATAKAVAATTAHVEAVRISRTSGLWGDAYCQGCLRASVLTCAVMLMCQYLEWGMTSTLVFLVFVSVGLLLGWLGCFTDSVERGQDNLFMKVRL